jgi:hypothetical protein
VGASLNEHNLFGKAADAQLFKVESDSRVAEHAPFSVFGVYLVRELGNERKSEQR